MGIIFSCVFSKICKMAGNSGNLKKIDWPFFLRIFVRVRAHIDLNHEMYGLNIESTMYDREAIKLVL